MLLRYALLGLVSAPFWLVMHQPWWMGAAVSPFLYLIQTAVVAGDIAIRFRAWSYQAADLLTALVALAVTYPLWIVDRLWPAFWVFACIYLPVTVLAKRGFGVMVAIHQFPRVAPSGLRRI